MRPSKGKQQLALERRVLDFIQENHLLLNQHKLLVAVSGGPDSVCLFHILVNLQEELGIILHVAHLDHQIRGAESEADAQYVSKLACQSGIPVTIDRRDVKAYQSQHHSSLEEAAREVRYTFLTQVAKSIEANNAAVGHTTDDNVETILMHLIRGSGIRGLRGLQPSNLWQSSSDSITVIRPLLIASRTETINYCHEHQLTPRIDTSNLSLSPLRNRIRHQLLPLLKSYNPRIVDALLRTARIAEDDLAFIGDEVARLWDKVVQEKENFIILNKERFLGLPVALQRYLLRIAIDRLIGNLMDIETRHIREIMTALNKPAGKRISLPGDLVFSIEYERYLIGPEPSALSPFPALATEFSLKIPGETRLSGWHMKATVISTQQMTETNEDFIAYLDLDKAGRKLMVRSRKRGDRFHPLGMNQPKKLGEFMIDAKIPRVWRQQIPIVCSPEQILWVVGWRIDDRVKVTDATQRVLRLKATRTG